MPWVNVNAEVDVRDILDEIDDDDLIEELERRGLDMNTEFVDGDTTRDILTRIWENRRVGKDYQRELDDLIYYCLGKII